MIIWELDKLASEAPVHHSLVLAVLDHYHE